MKKFNYPALIILFGTLLCSGVSGQVKELSPEFFSANRKELIEQLPENSVAILFSSTVKNRSNDVNYPFQQNTQFYYLTGIREPNSVLLIYKSKKENADNAILFIPVAGKFQEQWTGKITSLSEAIRISGIREVYNSCSYDTMKMDAISFDKLLYLPLPAGLTDDKTDSCDLYNLVESFKRKVNYPPANGDTYLLGKILRRMREIKKPEEISIMRKAISISCEGHLEMMRTLNSKMSEYNAQAVGEFVFKTLGAEDVGYPSICGGGENSCVLHYESNRRKLNDGDLLLLDMGAAFNGYNADITRTLPVNGTFSKEQKIIYELVLKAQDSAMSQCKPGNNFNDPHRAATAIIKNGLMQLGIISNEEDYQKYFMHGTSHYLGLDVHDAGTMNKLAPGNVITVEPGIYIAPGSPCDKKWWNIGIRIEDDVLITSDGHENLSADLPSRADDIEKIMKQEPVFIKEKK